MKHTPIREAVARRLYNRWAAFMDESCAQELPWEQAPDSSKQMWGAYADAALSEIRAFLEEPTEEMLMAARDVEMISLCEGDPTASVPDDANIWRAMLRTALASSGEGE